MYDFRSLSRAAAIAFSLLAAGAAAGAEARTEVPIGRVTIPGGTPRFFVPVRIGDSQPIDAMLDTGSAGLRVLPSAYEGVDGISDTGAESDESYGSGVLIAGTVGDAVIHVGTAVSDDPLGVQLVKDVGCTRHEPRCPASRITLGEYGFGGNGLANKGFKAIIGVRLVTEARGGIRNPLLSIGAARWIIELPAPNQDSGRLILNPDEGDLEGYALAQVVPETGGGVHGCLENGDTHRRFCGPALLDTGAPGVGFATNEVNDRVTWKAGTPGQLAFGNGQGDPSMSFRANPRDAVTHVTLTRAEGTSDPLTFHPGVLPFYGFSVYFDGDKQVIGFKKR